jgi:hypothetical protein
VVGSRVPQSVTVFLTPHAGVWPHALAELPLMKALAADNTRVIALTCEGVLSYQCTVMHARRINAESPRMLREAVCVDCRSADRQRRRLDEVEWVHLSTLLTPEDFSQISEICDRTTVDDVPTLRQDGLPIGATSSYETILHAKSRPVDALRTNWPSYIGDLRGALICMRAFQRLMERESVDTVIVYNGLYSANRAVWETALKVGVRALDIHATSHPIYGYEYLRIEGKLWPRFEAEKAEAWRTWRDVPLNRREIAFAHRYLEAGILSAAPWAYSGARSSATKLQILERLSLSPAAPTVAVLLNSLDERIAATFVGVNVDAAWPLDQETPIDRFIDMALSVAKRRPDWQFIVRVHPRMAAGKRDGVTSPELAALKERLAVAPSNVAIDWPSMGLSLFDIALVTDCALSIGTTAGVQLMGLGIPTVLCNRSQEWNVAPDLYITTEPEDAEATEGAIERALAAGANLATARKIYRFIVFQDLRSASRVRGSREEDARIEPSKSRRAMPAKHVNSLARWLATRDPTGAISGTIVIVKSLFIRGKRRSQTDEVLAAASSLTRLVDQVRGNRQLGSERATPSDAAPPRDEAHATETLELQASLSSLYTLLGVKAPTWATYSSEVVESRGD